MIAFKPHRGLLRQRWTKVRGALDGVTHVRISEPIELTVPTQAAFAASTRAKTRQKPKMGFLGKVINHAATLAIAVSVLVMAVLFVPQLYYSVQGVDVKPIQTTEEGTPLGGNFADGTQGSQTTAAPTPVPYQPPKDETLPQGDWLVIPRIGVRTQLRATDVADEALNEGVWMVPGYGKPGDMSQPIIVAAHRFGWKWWWQSDYWKYNSFYLLPDTQPGDIVEVISDQRKWTYEIYGGEEGQEITDYNADMILYTCKLLDSPVRHFRYARLINPEADSQQ